MTAGQNTLGSASSVTITNGATLDLDSQTLNQSVTVAGAGVGGAGVIINSGNDIYNSVLSVTLNGDAVFGGSGRWDLASGSSISGPHKLTVMRANSGSYGEWVGVTNAMNVGDIELAVGKLGIKNMGTTFGNPAGNFIVDSGTELDFWTGDPGYAKNFHVLSGGVMQILTGFASFSGSLILEDHASFTAYGATADPTRMMNGAVVLNGVAHLVLGDGNFIFTNAISGPGGFVWDAYNHSMVFQASNTYAGPTVVAQGMDVALSGNGSISHSTPIFFGGTDSTSVHLDASGRSDQTFTLAGGQTLGGIGAVTGNLVSSAGATIAPAGTNTTIGITVGANPTGAISASGNVTLGGTTVIKLDGSGSNDMVQAGGNITYGGTLSLQNISGAPFNVGDTFHIFSAVGYSGSFTGGITPATPGSGLAWDTTQLLSGGTISVVTGSSQPILSAPLISGTNFIFSGSNGPVGHNYVVLTSTKLAAPLANWVPVLTNAFGSDGSFHVTNGINPAAGRDFYLLQVQ
jgi:fibronectin-binding autotransporter adhesin